MQCSVVSDLEQLFQWQCVFQFWHRFCFQCVFQLGSIPVNISLHWFASNPEGPGLPLVNVAARFIALSSKLSKIDGWNGSTFSDGDSMNWLLTSPGLGCFSFNTWSTVLSPILSDKSSTPPFPPSSSCLMAFATFPFVMCLTNSFLLSLCRLQESVLDLLWRAFASLNSSINLPWFHKLNRRLRIALTDPSSLLFGLIRTRCGMVMAARIDNFSSLVSLAIADKATLMQSTNFLPTLLL